MTYCVGLKLDRGLVFMSDTRTNAGVDNISVFRKMFHWDAEGERSITLMTAGNLATTQAVVSLLHERALPAEERGSPSIMEAPSMFQVATYVGQLLKDVIATHAETGQRADAAFNATMILGGQIGDGKPCLFLIYPEGNFIEATTDAPFFQIGETKYGKPIIVRAQDPAMRFEDAVKLLMVSFDSTIKSNLSVGLPLDYATYVTDSFRIGHADRIDADNTYFQTVSNGWGEALKVAFDQLPEFAFDTP